MKDQQKQDILTYLAQIDFAIEATRGAMVDIQKARRSIFKELNIDETNEVTED